MKVSDEIQEQLAAVLGGRWVQHSPGLGEACAMARWQDGVTQHQQLSERALVYVTKAMHDIGHEHGCSCGDRSCAVAAWNDWPSTTQNEVIEVLERAHKYALMNDA